MSLFSLAKNERLSRKKSIDRLFREGASFFNHPVKVYWLLTPVDSGNPAQVMVIVGKRAFKRAVDRNKIKRQIREIYRLEKPGLYEFLKANDRQCQFCLIYTSNNLPDYHELERKIKLIFRRLINEIESKLNNNKRSLSEY